MSPFQGRKWYRNAFVTLLILLVAVSALVRWRLDPVPVSGADATTTGFSAVRAMKSLTTVLGDERPHPVDSNAQRVVRERIVTELEGFGYAVEVQDATSCNDNWGVTCARVRNLVVISPGTEAEKAILLMAHYDSVPAGPGASDDGSGVAVLMDVARLLIAQPPGRNPVIMLITDGEEAGLLGAKAFAEQDSRVRDVALAINVESRGTSGQSVMFQTGDDSGWLVDTYAAVAQRPFTNSLVSSVYDLMPNDTDFTVFKNMGVPSLNFAFGESFPYYHTSKDNLQSLDIRTLQQQGDNAYRLISTLRDADLAAAAEGTAANLVYTDILGIVVIRWPSSWSLGILFALLAFSAFVARTLKRRHAVPLGSIALGFTCFFLVVALGGTGAWLMSRGLALIHGPATAWHSNLLGNRLLLWSVVLLATVWLPRLLTRRSSPLGLLTGMGAGWLLSGFLAALLLPGLAYIFILPAAALALMGLIAVLVSQRLREQALSALFFAPSLIAFVVILPAVFIVETLISFSLPGAIGMGVLLAVAVSLLIPLTLPTLGGRTHRDAGAAVALVAVIGAVWSLAAPAYSDAQPQPLNVTYIQQGDGNGHVFTGDPHAPLPALVKKAMGADAAYLEVLPWSSRRFYSVPVAHPLLAVPELTILTDHETAAGREVVARIDAGPNIQRLTLLVPTSAGLATAEMDGHVMTYQGYASKKGPYRSFVCHGESCDGKQLKLTMTGSLDSPVLLLKAVAGVPPQAASIVRSRDNSPAVPVGNGDETLIVNSMDLRPRMP